MYTQGQSTHKGKVRNDGTSHLAMVASWVGRPLCHLRVNDVYPRSKYTFKTYDCTSQLMVQPRQCLTLNPNPNPLPNHLCLVPNCATFVDELLSSNSHP